MPKCSSCLRGPTPEYISSRGVSTEPQATMISRLASTRSMLPLLSSVCTAVARLPENSIRWARVSVRTSRLARLPMIGCRYITLEDERTPVASLYPTSRNPAPSWNGPAFQSVFWSTPRARTTGLDPVVQDRVSILLATIW